MYTVKFINKKMNKGLGYLNNFKWDEKIQVNNLEHITLKNEFKVSDLQIKIVVKGIDGKKKINLFGEYTGVLIEGVNKITINFKDSKYSIDYFLKVTIDKKPIELEEPKEEIGILDHYETLKAVLKAEIIEELLEDIKKLIKENNKLIEKTNKK